VLLLVLLLMMIQHAVRWLLVLVLLQVRVLSILVVADAAGSRGESDGLCTRRGLLLLIICHPLEV
jgi:hypothetical protein